MDKIPVTTSATSAMPRRPDTCSPSVVVACRLLNQLACTNDLSRMCAFSSYALMARRVTVVCPIALTRVWAGELHSFIFLIFSCITAT